MSPAFLPYKYLIGVDEVGRGPIAGPVAVGAFAFLDGASVKKFSGVKDSKQLTHEERKKWRDKIDQLRASGLIDYRVAFVSEQTIDKKGLTFAIKSAMAEALAGLSLAAEHCRVILDGGLKAPTEYKNQQTFIKGDEKRRAIALASIVAKVARDELMIEYAKQYVGYGFEVHKGYATRSHYESIKRLGLCPLHRRSFLTRVSYPQGVKSE